jgi:hypothetical protein
LNTVLHHAMQQHGFIRAPEFPRQVLITRNDLTGADRKWAARYQPDDVIRYTKGSEPFGLTRGSYATVIGTEATDAVNRITVRTDAGRTLTYDPSRLSGVTVYREETRQFAVGDRIQFTAPDRGRGRANRQRGTVENLDHQAVTIQLDKGGRVTIPAHERQHVDHGYALTSHASQGETVDRVLLHTTSMRSPWPFKQSRASAMTKVGESRPALEARLEDGSRVAAMMRPCSVDGPTLTIRKFTARLSLLDLVARGCLPMEVAIDLQRAIELQKTSSSRVARAPARRHSSTPSPASFRTATGSYSSKTPPRSRSRSRTWCGSRRGRRRRGTRRSRPSPSRICSVTRSAIGRTASSWARCAGLKPTTSSKR